MSFVYIMCFELVSYSTNWYDTGTYADEFLIDMIVATRVYYSITSSVLLLLQKIIFLTFYPKNLGWSEGDGRSWSVIPWQKFLLFSSEVLRISCCLCNYAPALFKCIISCGVFLVTENSDPVTTILHCPDFLCISMLCTQLKMMCVVLL